jgi:hypothetical protein
VSGFEVCSAFHQPQQTVHECWAKDESASTAKVLKEEKKT